MAHLYFTDVTNNTKKSTETIYEIKAPLATFDTIDLDDWEEDSVNKSPSKNEINNDKKVAHDKPEKGIEELSEQSSTENKVKQNKSCKESIERYGQEDIKTVADLKSDFSESVKDLDTPTPTEECPQFDNVSVSTLNSESENNAPQSGGATGDLMDPNSSENNASAEEIQTKLKEKGRKHKEKTSKVKYEKIDSTSDISDQERSENFSPLPAVKLRGKVYDSESDSSDSDSGYIRTGFVSAARGIGARHIRAGISNSAQGLDFVDSDSTPCSSPKITRPTIPPPLSEEDAAKRSKKKAYEKRLQRLQVTTTPIERPRSTTPISIHGLEEYVNISSPEKSPAKGSLEKLKIKLPLDDTSRSKSPRRTVKPGLVDSGDAQVFSFNEELLFTHTKSAILLEEDGSKCQSPRRILVPPTLSPKLSPARLPRSPRSSRQGSPNLPRYIYSPKSPRSNKQNQENQSVTKEVVPEQENWAKFDDLQPNKGNSEEEQELNQSVAQFENNVNIKGKTANSEANNEILKSKSTVLDDSAKVEEFDSEEILTVKIDKSGDTTKCDIEYHTAESAKNKVDVDKLKEVNSNGTEKRNGACIIGDEENIDSLC